MITLDLATRANLNALLTTQSLLNRTSQRIATGLRVSKPSDDSQLYFAAESVSLQAQRYTLASSEIQQARYALEAALSGLEGIKRLLDNAAGLAATLSNAKTSVESDTLRSQYNELLAQIDKLANAASYQGVNLINNSVSALNIAFSGIYGQNDLTINAIRSDSAGLTLSTVAAGLFFQATTTIASQSSRESIASIGSIASVASRAAISAVPPLASQNSVDSRASNASVASLGSLASNASNPSVPSQSSQPSLASIASIASRPAQVQINAANSTPSFSSLGSVGSLASSASLQSVAGVAVPGVNVGLISAISTQLQNATSTVSASQAIIGILNAVLQVRTEFSKNFVAVSQDQISRLTAAELTQETANLKSLETTQSFGLAAFTITLETRRNLLRLF